MNFFFYSVTFVTIIWEQIRKRIIWDYSTYAVAVVQLVKVVRFSSNLPRALELGFRSLTSEQVYSISQRSGFIWPF